jgi:RHS repeat-associated protein
MCHDGQGRLTSTTDPLLTGGTGTAELSHDGLGRIVRIEGIARPVSLAYGIGGDLVRMREAIDTTNPVTTEFTSFGGSVLTRTVTSAAGTSAVTFGAGGVLQLATDDSGAVEGLSAVVLDLPGGARATIPVGGKATISHTGISAEAMATTAAPTLGDGPGGYAPASEPGVAEQVGPYGERLGEADIDPDSAAPTYVWQSASRADTLPGSTGITVLGARSYLPATGEFLSPDPVVDSGQNLYGYTDGDPVNANDVTGNESQDDMTWTITAASAAGMALVLGVIQAFIPVGNKFMLSVAKGEITTKWQAIKGVLRLSPAKTAVMAGVVGLSATAGVATAMALRNQMSESWQAVLIGVGAGVASLGLSAGATAAIAKIRLVRALRRAAAPSQAPARPVSSSSFADSVIESSSVVDRSSIRSFARPQSVEQPVAVQPESAFALRRANGRWDQVGGEPVFIKPGRDGSREVIAVNKL